jgi:hypothetical protein
MSMYLVLHHLYDGFVPIQETLWFSMRPPNVAAHQLISSILVLNA